MLCSLHLIIIKDLSAQVGGNAIYIIMIFPYGHASYFFICYTFIVHLMFRLVCQLIAYPLQTINCYIF